MKGHVDKTRVGRGRGQEGQTVGGSGDEGKTDRDLLRPLHLPNSVPTRDMFRP